MSAQFLLGVIVTASLTAAVFFFRFWKRSGDRLFLAFGAAFAIEGLNRLRFLSVEDPLDASPSIYVVRLLAFLLVLTAIIAKNRSPRL